MRSIRSYSSRTRSQCGWSGQGSSASHRPRWKAQASFSLFPSNVSRTEEMATPPAEAFSRKPPPHPFRLSTYPRFLSWLRTLER